MEDSSSGDLPARQAMIHGQNISISGGIFTLNINGQQSDPENRDLDVIKHMLGQNFAACATHDNNDVQDFPKCHPGTRTAILQDLHNWIRASTELTTLMWFFGPAGSGKSAIARSLADIMAQEGGLAASFFFLRSDRRRNTTKDVVTTLVFQIAHSIPIIRSFLSKALTGNLDILHRSLATQFDVLLIKPFTQLVASLKTANLLSPMIIIIDGLDECEDRNARSSLLQVIGAASRSLPHFIKFLIVSRPEVDIDSQFQQINPQFCLKRELLADLQAYEDVRRYLEDEFTRIRHTHPLRSTLNEHWVSDRVIELLVENSSGFWIYATTVTKYVDYAADNPMRALQVVLGLRSSSRRPLDQLDALYRGILTASRVDAQVLHDILYVVAGYNDLGMSHWQGLNSVPPTDLMVEDVLSLEAHDVELALVDIRSLIAFNQVAKRGHWVATDDNGRGPNMVIFHHKSFTDFLFDDHRSREFHVDIKVACTMIAKGCLKALSNPDFLTQHHWRGFDSSVQWKYLPDYTGWWEREFYHTLLTESCRKATPDSDLVNLFLQYDPWDTECPFEFEFDHAQRFVTSIFLFDALKNNPEAFQETEVSSHLQRRLDEVFLSAFHALSSQQVGAMTQYFTLSSRIPGDGPFTLRKGIWRDVLEENPVETFDWLSSWFFRNVRHICHSYAFDLLHSRERAKIFFIDEDKMKASMLWLINEGPIGAVTQENRVLLLVLQIFHPQWIQQDDRHALFFLLPRVASIAANQHLSDPVLRGILQCKAAQSSDGQCHVDVWCNTLNCRECTATKRFPRPIPLAVLQSVRGASQPPFDRLVWNEHALEITKTLVSKDWRDWKIIRENAIIAFHCTFHRAGSSGESSRPSAVNVLRRH
ncbi:hypothetical protein CPB83DRAFT_856836 [Crepidotus variabilis]|uniref:NACHT domain-containing protein n=1 Tax=Crepidotus variabilis TaxID=179855 RepID=A0A9P6JP06_9AGAR|nr:hypothetical protein CPB83DRAFT_856836 [Crepidotus variabilis]